MSDSFYRVNETFVSIQGEGAHAGRTALFIRLQGCSVQCTWCDSKTTWFNGGTKYTLAEIDDLLKTAKTDLVIITGGEPLEWNLDELLVRAHRYFPGRVHLETSGAYPIKGRLRPSWITVSPKRAAGWKVDPNVLRLADELKYVVDDEFVPEDVYQHIPWYPYDAASVRTYIEPHIYLMPEGAPPKSENVERIMQILAGHPQWRFSPRLQYDYGAITKREGSNNQILTRQAVLAEAKAQRLAKKANAQKGD